MDDSEFVSWRMAAYQDSLPTRHRGRTQQPDRQYTINWEYSQPHLYFYSAHQIESKIRFFHQSIQLLLFLLQASRKYVRGVTLGLSILISVHWLQRSKSLVRQKLEPVTNYRARSTFLRRMALALKNWRASRLWEALQIPISSRHSSIARYEVQTWI